MHSLKCNSFYRNWFIFSLIYQVQKEQCQNVKLNEQKIWWSFRCVLFLLMTAAEKILVRETYTSKIKKLFRSRTLHLISDIQEYAKSTDSFLKLPIRLEYDKIC